MLKKQGTDRFEKEPIRNSRNRKHGPWNKIKSVVLRAC